MPASKSSPSKRKATGSPETASKKPKIESKTDGQDMLGSSKGGYVDRRFYPEEMSNARCLEYNDNKHVRPIEKLDEAVEATRKFRTDAKVKNAVVHWFKSDLRTRDNKALRFASEKAKSSGTSLICIYILSPQDFEAHVTSPARVDFILRTLEILKEDLAKLDIPLYMETVEKRKTLCGRILDLCDEWGASHLYTNIEYEVDELRREAALVFEGQKRGVAVNPVPDTCVVSPGELSSGTGSQYAVYSPWYRAWMAYLHKHPNHLTIYDAPTQNPASVQKSFKNLFGCKVPEAPKGKQLDEEEKKRLQSIWPAGEHQAHERLDKFLKEKIKRYDENRNFPAADLTSKISVHFTSGTLSARSAVIAAQNVNSTKKLDGGNKSIVSWISEVAWRDFYKHVMVHWPFVCMNKPFKPDYCNIDWEYDEEHFAAWREGRTGYPIVDAAMRQLDQTCYMHNRCRMIVSSFLAKDLMLDWRLGERYFMSRLIDGDFASNNGGWGFGASTGVDPQPYFRIFNPVLQSEKFDADGEYIRKWVPELRGVKGKAIHEPYARGAAKEAGSKGYPKPIVEHKFARDRALSRYKAGLGRETA